MTEKGWLSGGWARGLVNAKDIEAGAISDRHLYEGVSPPYPVPVPRWKRVAAWVWIAAVIGGAVYYAYWQGHFNALHLAGCAI